MQKYQIIDAGSNTLVYETEAMNKEQIIAKAKEMAKKSKKRVNLKVYLVRNIFNTEDETSNINFEF